MGAYDGTLGADVGVCVIGEKVVEVVVGAAELGMSEEPGVIGRTEGALVMGAFDGKALGLALGADVEVVVGAPELGMSEEPVDVGLLV